jgi:glutathione-regulated potassium-efflux system ancillary protein KefC
MDFAWVALALNDLLWIGTAFLFGLLAKQVGLPPLVGYLVTGFLLGSQNIVDESLLTKMADLGITLLLFTIGLKIHLRSLLQPQIWGVTFIHTTVVVVVIGLLIFTASLLGLSQLAGMSVSSAALLAFAMSFSSTVFVVKAMEQRGEMDAMHGRIAIGVLIVQDIFAVVFLAISTAKLPSIWAIALLLLIPLRFVLFKVLEWVGRGELLILYGLLLAIGGAEMFELVGIKGDLGALILGVLIAPHFKSEELVKNMLGFKDLFLLGFFLSIGVSGLPDTGMLLLALCLTPLALLKGALFFKLFVKFNLRARTALLSTINLSNFSEFGLIVIAIGVSNQWIDNQWLIIMALMISFSFVISAILNKYAYAIYRNNREAWKRFQSDQRLPNDQILNIDDAKVAVIGMGTVGTGAYNRLYKDYRNQVVGIEINSQTVKEHHAAQRNVIHGDPSDADFWDRIYQTHQLELVMLTLPKFSATLAVVELLVQSDFKGKIAATAKFADEMEQLKKAGVDTVFNMHTEAGAGFASHVLVNQSQQNNA